MTLSHPKSILILTCVVRPIDVPVYTCVSRYGLSEDFLAAWLESRDVDPSKVAVGTKWGYDYTAKWQVVTRPLVACLSTNTTVAGAVHIYPGRFLSIYPILVGLEWVRLRCRSARRTR